MGGNITSVIIPSNIKTIGAKAFNSCYSLTSVTISNGVETIGNGAFTGCDQITSIAIPESVKNIGENAFSACRGIKTLTIANGVQNIDSMAFKHCSGITTVTIPASVKSIGSEAFFSCTSLESVIILNGLESVGSRAFGENSALVSIKIPDSVKSIENDAFWCSAVVIYCSPNSYAETYAKNNAIHYVEKSIEELKVTLSQTTYTYDNKEKRPTVTVKDGNKTLKLGTDYTVSYTKNKAIGKAIVTITGTSEGEGGYEGTVKKTFTIKKGDYYSRITHGGTWKNESYTLGGVKMTDVFFFDGAYTYYLQADGTPMKNRLTYHPDGVHLIYFDDKGHELFDKFQYCKDVGYTCYFDSSGYLYKDVITFKDDKVYYLDGDGRMKQNEYFRFGNGVDLGYAQEDGSLINTGFGYDPFGQVVFYHWNGMIARGLITDGAWYYNMDETDGHLIGKFAVN